jgi:hypothetical protein
MDSVMYRNLDETSKQSSSENGQVLSTLRSILRQSRSIPQFPSSSATSATSAVIVYSDGQQALHQPLSSPAHAPSYKCASYKCDECEQWFNSLQ